MRPCLLLYLLSVPAGSFASAADPTPIPVSVPSRRTPVSYANEVADVLAAKCVGCHNDALAENRLNLEGVAGMLKGGKKGPAVVPGKADQSLLFTMAAHRVEPVMPPSKKKDAPPLTGEELGLLKLWIDAGAKDDSDESGEATRPVQLGALPPGVHPVGAVDVTADGTRLACGRANLVQVFDVDSGLEIVTLGGHQDLIQSVKFSPDGRLLAAGSYEVVTLWNAPIGGLAATYSGHTDQVKGMAVLGRRGTLVSGGLDRSVRFWGADGKVVRTLDVPSPVLCLAASEEGSRLVVGCADGVAHLYNVAGDLNAKEVATFRGHSGPINDVVLADRKGGSLVVTASTDATVRIWRENAAEPERVLFSGDKGPLHAVALTRTGVLLTAGEGGKIHRWNVEDGKPLRSMDAHDAPILAMALDPTDRYVLTGSSDGVAKRVDLRTDAVVTTYHGHSGPVHSVTFDGDGPSARVVTAGADGGVKVWESETGQGVIAFGHTPPTGGPQKSVQKVVRTGPGAVVSASADKTLKGWRYEGSWSERRPLGPHSDRVLALDFNPDGTLLAAGGGEPSRSGEIKLWEVGKGMLVRTLGGLHSDTVFGVRFSPDGQRLASAGADKFMKVTRVSDGKEVRSFEGHTHHVMAVDWKSDGKQLVTGGADNVLKVWDGDSGEQVRTLQGAGKQVTALRWLPGKSQIAGASGDKVVRFWTAEGGVARTFNGPTDYVFSVAASADGSRVAAGGADGVLFVWNGLNGQVIRKIEPTTGAR